MSFLSNSDPPIIDMQNINKESDKYQSYYGPADSKSIHNIFNNIKQQNHILKQQQTSHKQSEQDFIDDQVRQICSSLNTDLEQRILDFLTKNPDAYWITLFTWTHLIPDDHRIKLDIKIAEQITQHLKQKGGWAETHVVKGNFYKQITVELVNQNHISYRPFTQNTKRSIDNLDYLDHQTPQKRRIIL